MTNSNDTHESIYNQVMTVKKHMEALKDVYESMPDTYKYSSVFSIVGDGMDKEIDVLCSMALKGCVSIGGLKSA